MNFGRRDAGILEAVATRLDGAAEEVGDKGLEARARERHGEVLGTRGICGDERKVDVRLRRR